jgi:Tol biopolymer transport system component
VTPAFSPDGTKIAFTSNLSGNYEIHAMNADGSSQKRLTRKAALESSPGWSPDGKKIAFMSDRDGDEDIYTMKAKPEGTKNRPKNLTNADAAHDFEPNWQPLVN